MKTLYTLEMRRIEHFEGREQDRRTRIRTQEKDRKIYLEDLTMQGEGKRKLKSKGQGWG